MIVKPIVLKAEPNRELRWLERLWIPGLFNGEHMFIIKPLEKNRVRFIHAEKFTGLLIPFVGGTLDDTQRGFEEMDRALKERAERNSNS